MLGSLNPVMIGNGGNKFLAPVGGQSFRAYNQPTIENSWTTTSNQSQAADMAINQSEGLVRFRWSGDAWRTSRWYKLADTLLLA